MKYLPNNLFVSCVILSLIAAPQVQANWFSKGLDLLKGSSSENTEETSEGNTSIVSNLLSNDTLIEGFKEALAIGSEKVSSQLSADGGFSADELIHIPLPDNLKTAQSVLGRIGLSSLGDDLELKLNQAAEAAVPEAKELFVNAIQSMTFEDIQAIYKGPNDSATQFFKANMADDLSERMLVPYRPMKILLANTTAFLLCPI